MQLLYRGISYHYSPIAPQVSGAAIVQSRALFYRGNHYTARLLPLQSYRQPASVNWRFQVSDVYQPVELDPAHS